MPHCTHKNLTLLPVEKRRLRCRRCHLTIMAEELGDGYCPECLEIHDKKHNDFEVVTEKEPEKTRYRCEWCGVIIELKS